MVSNLLVQPRVTARVSTELRNCPLWPTLQQRQSGARVKTTCTVDANRVHSYLGTRVDGLSVATPVRDRGGDRVRAKIRPLSGDFMHGSSPFLGLPRPHTP